MPSVPSNLPPGVSAYMIPGNTPDDCDSMTDMHDDEGLLLWCDLKTDHERAAFIRSGRAVATGIIAEAIADDVAKAFEYRAKHQNEPLPDCDTVGCSVSGFSIFHKPGCRHYE